MCITKIVYAEKMYGRSLLDDGQQFVGSDE